MDSECVRVAVNIRPLITPELLVGCTDCITVVPGEPQVQIGSHAFTYDFVYGNNESPSSAIYNDCIAPLVDAIFNGYNATVLAYGQLIALHFVVLDWFGKDIHNGTNYSGDGSENGIIPKVMENIFSRLDRLRGSTEFLIRVSFIEIFKEEVFDLLHSNSAIVLKGEGGSVSKPVVPARVPIQIRETVNGGITLAGVTEAEVRSKEEMASYLSQGSVARATGSTNMNSQSSRSHAIFTITMEQKKIALNNEDTGDDILLAKLHLVDLAGSERAKRTGADGLRFKEGIHINKGLLALGNVISALGDEKKRKEGGHVPYRDSKLTRLLQDSLGGNSKTVMIACVSPADTNAEETLNTLKYANRARNIQNKAIINRDPVAAQIQRMRSQIEQLQAELLFYRGDGTTSFDELQILRHKVSLLEASKAELQRELEDRRITCEQLSQRAVDEQVEKDKLIIQIESARNGKSWDEIDSLENQDGDLLKTYVSKIQELEGELVRLKNLSNSKSNRFSYPVDSDEEGPYSKNILFPPLEEFLSNPDSKDENEVEEKELEHSSLQEKLDRELKELDKRLEQKEAEMKQFASSDASVLKLHYEKKVHELEIEKRALQREIEELRNNLANISATSDDGAQKLKDEYLQKLTVLESQVAELKKKQDAQAQLLRQKHKSDEAASRLQVDIQRIKSQKVQLQNKIKQESEQFRLWKASREKEVLQLKKEGRRNEYEMHKLLALNQRQKMVLQRKSEEAAMATKRLKELLESQKVSSRDGAGNGPGIQDLMQTIEHELEVTVRVHEVCVEYERQMEERARMAKEVARLKEEAQMLKQTNLSDCSSSLSPGARNSRIFALENMLATSSSTLVSMASQLSEAEERESGFSGRGRWNQVRSLPEAKNLMNYLFNLAASSRCLARDKEADCREKDNETRELKGNIVQLSSVIKHLEMQKAELLHQIKFQNSASMNACGHNYELQKQAQQNSILLSEDMDIDTKDSGSDEVTDDELVKLTKRPAKKRQSRISFHDSSSCKKDVSTAGQTCCTCNKSSYCKTTKCQCRLSGGMCGTSCGCVASKCSNRAKTEELKPPATPDIIEIGSDSENTDKTSSLASQGASLLQSAPTDRPAETNEDGATRRKSLSDIGNTSAMSNAPKTNRRKKWCQSTIQFIPVPPPSSTQTENNEATHKPETTNNNNAIEGDVPLKKDVSTADQTCCTCSKSSYCKTTKCQCRLSGGMCGTSCGCAASKCSNRAKAEELKRPATPNIIEIGSDSENTDKTSSLASQGASLLQSALTDRPAATNEDGATRRKPLSDIGNTPPKSNAPKPNRRKQWRQSTIQFIPVPPPQPPPPSSTQTEDDEAT